MKVMTDEVILILPHFSQIWMRFLDRHLSNICLTIYQAFFSLKKSFMSLWAFEIIFMTVWISVEPAVKCLALLTWAWRCGINVCQNFRFVFGHVCRGIYFSIKLKLFPIKWKPIPNWNLHTYTTILTTHDNFSNNTKKYLWLESNSFNSRG